MQKKTYSALSYYIKLQNIEIRRFCIAPLFQKGRLSRKLRQYAGASLMESSFFLYTLVELLADIVIYIVLVALQVSECPRGARLV